MARFSGRFEVVGLAAARGSARLVEQVRNFRPRRVAVADAAAAQELRQALAEPPEIRHGPAAAQWVASMEEADFVLSAIGGGAGMLPTAAAIEAGKVVGLANKESLVLAGELLTARAKATGARLLPIDSEHSAIFQCLSGHRTEDVRRLILTASGGPFWDKPAAAFRDATPAEALRHPNWSMGDKITVDSATLMNKGLEVIEARWLFDLPPEQIDILVHPQSLVHSMVEFRDGALIAQLGISDMRGPIAHALAFPERLPIGLPPLDLTHRPPLTFAEPDPARFPATRLAYRALTLGGTAPAVLSGADEAAVAAFLAGRIPLPGVTEVVAEVLEVHRPVVVSSVATAWEASEWARHRAMALVEERSGTDRSRPSQATKAL
jgi:1-deoxy-D-xylulose-5-phosphate reductoisomerase